MNSASKAFGEWPANFGISCLNEKVIFEDLNVFNQESQNPYEYDRTQH